MYCPYCKSDNTTKEVIFGQKTGDWVCHDCKRTFDKEDYQAMKERDQNKN